MKKTEKNIVQREISKEDIQSQIIKLIRKRLVGFEKISINEETFLSQELSLDSLDRVELVFDLENAFNIEIFEEDVKFLRQADQVKNLVNYVYCRLTTGRIFSQRQKTTSTKIELYTPNSTTIQFRQNNTILKLNHPQVSPLVKMLQETLAKQK